jgi:hypothetical protein
METTPASHAPDRLAAAEAALEEALLERNRLWEQLQSQQADRRELEHLRAELRAVRASRLWRLVSVYERGTRFVLARLESLRRR